MITAITSIRGDVEKEKATVITHWEQMRREGRCLSPPSLYHCIYVYIYTFCTSYMS